MVEKIPDAGLALSNSALNHGYVHCVRQIGTHLYVCGFEGQIYRREASGWVHIDEEILQKTGKISDIKVSNIKDPNELLTAFSKAMRETISLIDINGLDEKSIYVVGNNGYIAFFNGTNWKVLQKVTAANLNFVLPFSDGSAWIAGSKGTLLKGNNQSGFRAVVRKSLDTDFYSLAMFDGRLFIGAGNGIYELKEDIPRRLEVSDKYSLDDITSIEAKDDVLWVLSSQKLARYDGVSWEIFGNPHNI